MCSGFFFFFFGMIFASAIIKDIPTTLNGFSIGYLLFLIAKSMHKPALTPFLAHLCYRFVQSIRDCLDR